MNPYVIPWMDDDLEVFRDTVVRFIETEMVPHDARWREQHHVDRETWRKAGDTGLLLLDVPADYGGGGGDFRHEAVMYTELARRGIGAFGQGVHSMCAHYVLNHGTEDQKQRFLPRMAAGELIGAICMTEPGTGLRSQGHSHARGEAGRPLRGRWRQDFHHQRLPRRPAHAGRAHRCRSQQGPVDPHGRDEGSAGLSRRPRARQDGSARPGHLGAVLRRREGARRESARRRRRSGHASAHARPAV